MKKRMTLYLVLSFAFAWGVWICVYLMGWDVTNILVSLVLQAASLAPALAVLLVKLMDGENGPVLKNGLRPNFKGNIQWYVVAWLAPPVLMMLGAALYFMLFPGQLDFTMGYLRATYETAYAAAGLELSVDASMIMLGLVTTLVSSFTITPLMGIVYSIGEEIGWRGFMFPTLREKNGPVAAHLITGVVWGLWNAPLIVLMGQNYGFEYIGAPWLGVLAMCVFTFSNGVLVSWLAQKTGSVWVAALCRGSINAVASLPVLLLSMEQPVNLLLGPYTTGVIAGLPTLILAIVLMIGDSRQAKAIPAPDNTIELPTA